MLVVIPLIVGMLPVGAAPMGAGSVSGVVVDEQGNPLGGICVDIENGPGTQSAVDGTYTVTGVSPGEVKVGFRDCNPSPRFVTQWYLKHTDSNSADAVGVVDGTDTPLNTVTMIAGVSIMGMVKDGSGTPLAGITVSVSATEPNQASTSTTTDSLGGYATVPLAAGGYKVQFIDQTGTPVYAPQFWNKQPSWNTAELLKLEPGDGSTRGGIDGSLTVASTIQGTVRDAGGTPIEGACIDANVPTSGGGYDWVTGSSTAADGTYSVTQLPAADIRIRFRDCRDGTYLEQWYDGKPTFEDSTPIVLAAGDTRTGVDANLQTGIRVAGTVRDENGNPLPDISVNVNPTGNGPSVGTRTDVDGKYTTNSLPPGSYRVQFRDDASTPTYASQYWKNQPSYNGATILEIGSDDGPVLGDVNAALTRGASVKGVVTSPKGAGRQHLRQCRDRLGGRQHGLDQWSEHRIRRQLRDQRVAGDRCEDPLPGLQQRRPVPRAVVEQPAECRKRRSDHADVGQHPLRHRRGARSRRSDHRHGHRSQRQPAPGDLCPGDDGHVRRGHVRHG